MAFSRLGTTFFANPVAALRNIRQALAPGARLVTVVWRRRIDNEWIHRAQTIVEQIVSRRDEYDEPTCGPGPFSMADADAYAAFDSLTSCSRSWRRTCALVRSTRRQAGQAEDLAVVIPRSLRRRVRRVRSVRHLQPSRRDPGR
jgi:SAM-dependent methyltransferase